MAQRSFDVGASQAKRTLIVSAALIRSSIDKRRRRVSSALRDRAAHPLGRA
jgi:hypothetical protein